MWFEKLLGFKEENPEQVRKNIEIEGEYLISLVNGNRYKYGTLEISTLKELRLSAPPREVFKDKIKVSEVVGNVQHLHEAAANQKSLFQAASQFNLLEMVAPYVCPENGVDIYENDYTQGPACAIACGAGTIYRNYFAEVNGKIGQTADNQIDCLEGIGKILGNEKQQLWEMRNGYALVSEAGLEHISKQIEELSLEAYESLKGELKIGLQWNSEVTSNHKKHVVSQVYCSALPVSYSNVPSHLWEVFARLVLEASYEATFYAALRNYTETGNNKLFLTLVGGGAFGNRRAWIFDGIRNAIHKFKNTPLDVRIVSYGHSDSGVVEFIESL